MKIGMLGGVGPQATAAIYQSIIRQATSHYRAINNDDYPYLMVASVPVPDFISDERNIHKAKEMLTEAANNLIAAGCEVLCIGSNTVHILLEDLKAEVQTPFLSMIDLVSQECQRRGYKKVVLLGTPVLVKSGLYTKNLKERGVDLITPGEDQKRICEEVIRCVIANKSIERVKEKYIEVLNSMFSAGAEAIILGCTELPMVLNYEVFGRRVISSDEVLAKGIVDYYYSQTLIP